MNKYEARQTLAHARFFSTFFGVNKEGATRPTIRFWRFASIVGMHLLFVLSFWVDIQILEGDITGSRFVGFHLADPYVSLQVFLARHEFATNLIIGMSTILAFYVFIAGRAFCSWVCPYNLFSEFAERLNAKLVAKGVVKCHDFDPRVRYVFFVAFLLASFVSGFLVFEIVSVTGIVSRFIIYGYSAAIWWAVLVFVTEVFYSRRFWCRYVCPIGTLYSLVSRYRAVKSEMERLRMDEFEKETIGNKFRILTDEGVDKSVTYEGDTFGGKSPLTEMKTELTGSNSTADDRVRHFNNEMNNEMVSSAAVFQTKLGMIQCSMQLRDVNIDIFKYNRLYHIIFNDDSIIDAKYGGTFKLINATKTLSQGQVKNPMTSYVNCVFAKVDVSKTGA